MIRVLLLCCAMFCVSCDNKHRTPSSNVKVVELHGYNETDFEIGMDIVINKVSYGPGFLGPDGCKVMLTPIEVDRDFLVYVTILNHDKHYLAKVSHRSWADVIDIAKKFRVVYVSTSELRLEIYDTIDVGAKPIKVTADFEITPESGQYIVNNNPTGGR